MRAINLEAQEAPKCARLPPRPARVQIMSWGELEKPREMVESKGHQEQLSIMLGWKKAEKS